MPFCLHSALYAPKLMNIRKIASKAKSTNECNIVHKVFDEFTPWC